MNVRHFVLIALLATTALTFVPAVEASEPICTMAGCLDTCNATFCVRYPREVRELCADLGCPPLP